MEGRMTGDMEEKKLAEMSVAEFMEKLGSGNPTPGGGAAASLSAAMGASLLMMVANHTIGRSRYAEFEDFNIEVLKKAEALRARFIEGIDADADAFRQVSEAYRMAKDDPARPAAIGQASVIAAEAPLAVMEDSVAALRLAASLPGRCNRNLLSDVYVASYCLYAGLVSAAHNVEANLPSIRKSDPSLAEQMSDRAEELKKEGAELAGRI